METRHIDRRFEGQLQILRERILLMAGRVESMIERSVSALLHQDQELARATILQDRQVNVDEMETDEHCLQLLARQQTMGSDLRYITRSFKMVTDLERIGDLAVNICERALQLRTALPTEIHHSIPPMAAAVRQQLRLAIDSYVEQDVKKAQAAMAEDDRVDQMYRGFYRSVVTLMTQKTMGIETGIQVESVGKTLERMADHATNIAEGVIFMVQGTDIRHQGKDAPEGVEVFKNTPIY